MVARGENIGTAYVRILADGSTFDESVRDQMEDVNWKKFGSKAEQDWQDGWEEEAKKSANHKRLQSSITKPLVRGRWLTKEFFKDGSAWTKFRERLEREFGDAGGRAADNLEKSLYEGMSFDGLRARLDNLLPEVVKARKQLDAELAAVEKEAQRQQQRNLDNWFKDQLQGWKRYTDNIVKLNQDRDRDLENHWEELAKSALKDRLDRDRDLEAHWRQLAEDFTRIWDEAHDAGDGQLR